MTRADGRQPPRTAQDHLPAPLHHPRPGLGARQLRQHPGPLHGDVHRRRPALPAGQGAGLAHRGIRHAALLHRPAEKSGQERQGGRPGGRDSAPDRPLPAGGRGPEEDHRTHPVGRLRRAPGRRRHAHHGHQRGLRGPPRPAEAHGGQAPAAGLAPDHRAGRGLRGRGGRRDPVRPVLRRGQRRPDRHEPGDDRHGPVHRGPGVGRGRALQPRGARPHARSRVPRRFRCSSRCSATRSASEAEHRTRGDGTKQRTAATRKPRRGAEGA
jgi:hypothetical protein